MFENGEVIFQRDKGGERASQNSLALRLAKYSTPRFYLGVYPFWLSPEIMTRGPCVIWCIVNLNITIKSDLRMIIRGF